MEIYFGLILGLVIGITLNNYVIKRKYKRGEFIVDIHDVEKDVFTISMDTFNDIEKMKWIMFKVKNM